MDIGIKIAQARREQGITQVELANQMCVTRQTISRWETGAAYPDIEKVAGLAEILQVSCDYLLKETLPEKNVTQTGDNDNSSGNRNSITKLLYGIVGKKVRISFYEDEEDIDIEDEICTVDCFEGNWIRLTIPQKKGEKKKLIALSSVLSFEIINKEDGD